MTYSIEVTEGLERQVALTIPSDKIAANVNKEISRVARTAKIDGFRKGKAPLQMIGQRFGASILQDTISHLMEHTFWDAIQETKTNIAGQPTITPEEYKDGEDFKFKATFEVFPELKVEGLDQISLEIPKVEIKENDITKMLEVLRKQQGTWKDLEEGAVIKLDDRLTLDFKGTIDGSSFKGGEATDFVLVTNQNRMIEGFEAGIIGHKLGEEAFDVEATFPAEYQDKDLQGKKAVFNILVKRVEELTLPELNDEFIKTISKTSTNAEELKQEISKNLNLELVNMISAFEKNQAIKAVSELFTDMLVPKAAVDAEITTLMNQSMQQFGVKNLPKDFKLPREIFEEEASKRVKVGLILATIIETNKLEASDDEVKSKVESLSLAYENPAEFVQYYNADPKLLNQVRELLVEEKSIDFIKSQAKTSEKEFAFDELAAAIQG
ncbi:MAG: trigger factor [Psittacicella sp.]